ncbi:MAG: AAA family ATPase [Clostridium sp.]|nr:AAA family ATPase [Clostridium sp.]
MAEISIVIASLDRKYLSSLELSFTKKVASNVSLEIITDYEYLLNFFSIPRKIDCLIIDEDLYSEMVDKQHINCVFLFTEQTTDSLQRFNNIEYIYKFSSVKEIFHKVVGKMGLDINNGKRDGSKSVKTSTIMVYSPIGGSGKTIVALGLANQLADLNKKVLYLNVQSLQDFQPMVGDYGYCENGFDRYLMRKDPNVAKEMQRSVVNVGFDCLRGFKGSMLSYGITDEHYIFLIQNLVESKMYDYIIVDSSTEFSSINSKIMSFSDKVVVVATQGRSEEYKINSFIHSIEYSEDKFLFVCNKYAEKKKMLELPYNMTEFLYEIEQPEVGYLDICRYNALKATALVIL